MKPSVDRRNAVIQSFEENDTCELVDPPKHGTIVDLFRKQLSLPSWRFYAKIRQFSTLMYNRFLNGYLEENVFMKQQDGFVLEGFENGVCELKKGIYTYVDVCLYICSLYICRIKQSTRVWNKRVDEVLLGMNYSKPKFEPFTLKGQEPFRLLLQYMTNKQ